MTWVSLPRRSTHLDERGHTMPDIVRFGVSMDQGLLDIFDDLIAGKGYSNRSEAIRDMIRSAIVETESKAGNKTAVAALCIAYEHHDHNLPHKLMHAQHAQHHKTIASLHVHLDADRCLEVIVLKGKARDLQSLGNSIISMKGVKHGQLVLVT